MIPLRALCTIGRLVLTCWPGQQVEAGQQSLELGRQVATKHAHGRKRFQHLSLGQAREKVSKAQTVKGEHVSQPRKPVKAENGRKRSQVVLSVHGCLPVHREACWRLPAIFTFQVHLSALVFEHQMLSRGPESGGAANLTPASGQVVIVHACTALKMCETEALFIPYEAQSNTSAALSLEQPRQSILPAS